MDDDDVDEDDVDEDDVDESELLSRSDSDSGSDHSNRSAIFGTDELRLVNFDSGFKNVIGWSTAWKDNLSCPNGVPTGDVSPSLEESSSLSKSKTSGDEGGEIIIDGMSEAR